MQVEIIPVPLGIISAYVLRGGSVIAVDAGPRGKAGRFARRLAAAGIPAGHVQLIVLTHGHWDHIGSAREIKALTGARLAMHQADRACLEESVVRLPPGTTRWGKALMAIVPFLPTMHVPTATVDVVLGDDPTSLEDYGIPGRILHTPGHSAGSVTVLLDTGEAFVGDLAMNRFPLRLTPGFPIFAEDQAAVVASWHRLLKAGARVIYPAHGKPFAADVIRRALPA